MNYSNNHLHLIDHVFLSLVRIDGPLHPSFGPDYYSLPPYPMYPADQPDDYFISQIHVRFSILPLEIIVLFSSFRNNPNMVPCGTAVVEEQFSILRSKMLVTWWIQHNLNWHMNYKWNSINNRLCPRWWFVLTRNNCSLSASFRFSLCHSRIIHQIIRWKIVSMSVDNY